MSVWASTASFAFEYSTHSSRDFKSSGENFQRLIGLRIRSRKRRSCSSSLTENQYLSKIIPDLSSISSKTGQEVRNSSYTDWVQKPMTCSTPARIRAAVEEHYFALGRQLRHVALEIPLTALALGAQQDEAASRAAQRRSQIVRSSKILQPV